MVGGAGRREWVAVRARCLMDGEWLDGGTIVFLDKLVPGSNVINAKLRIGDAAAVAPSACRLGFDYVVMGVRDRVSLGKRCWNGTAITDAPCATIDRGGRRAVEIREVEIESSNSRMRTYTNEPRYLVIAVDGLVRGSVRGWQVEVTTMCTLADASVRTDHSQLYLRSDGEFTNARLFPFMRAKLAADPSSCKQTFELVDSYALVREPISTRCWKQTMRTAGPC
ncbi:MAG: hypothetical protein ABI867_21740 [Kofleriaceae bacterium]